MANRVNVYAVVCKWQDRRKVPHDEGHLALIVNADNPSDALLMAERKRPDLWADDGIYRETHVYPAEVLSNVC